MASNPFSNIGPAPDMRSQTERLKEAVDRGNSYLLSLGRHDIHWYVHEGQLCIGYKPARLVVSNG